jgi:hypothetical protein
MKRKITINRNIPSKNWINAQQDFNFVINRVNSKKNYTSKLRNWFSPTIASNWITIILLIALFN